MKCVAEPRKGFAVPFNVAGIRVKSSLQLTFVTSVADPWHFCIMDLNADSDPDPAIFIIDLPEANKKKFFEQSFSTYYFLKVHLHHLSKIKSQIEVTKQ